MNTTVGNLTLQDKVIMVTAKRISSNEAENSVKVKKLKLFQ
jgi:hypothetical protein